METFPHPTKARDAAGEAAEVSGRAIDHSTIRVIASCNSSDRSRHLSATFMKSGSFFSSKEQARNMLLVLGLGDWLA